MNQSLRFSPMAWAKILYMRDLGETEVGGFGISHKDDPLYIYDFQIVKQKCTMASIEFDDQSVSDFNINAAESGLHPSQYMRIWIHTHPGNSASPSSTDEKTFREAFGDCQWAIMFILAKGGDTYCRMQANIGPIKSLQIKLNHYVDYTSYNFHASDLDSWKREYEKFIKKRKNNAFKTKECKNKKENNKYENSFNDCWDWGWEDEEDVDEGLCELGLSDDIINFLDPNELSVLQNLSGEDKEEFIDHLLEQYGEFYE